MLPGKDEGAEIEAGHGCGDAESNGAAAHVGSGYGLVLQELLHPPIPEVCLGSRHAHIWIHSHVPWSGCSGSPIWPHLCIMGRSLMCACKHISLLPANAFRWAGAPCSLTGDQSCTASRRVVLVLHVCIVTADSGEFCWGAHQ